MEVNNTLQFDKIEETINLLSVRVLERFPGSSLGNTCKDFHEFTLKSKDIITWIDKPNYLLRIITYVFIFIMLALIVYSFTLIDLHVDNKFSEITTVLESSLNNFALIGAAIFFLVSLENRIKRTRAIKFLNEIRGFAHVVDMHQLTKDPQLTMDSSLRTSSSPKRDFTPFQLQRYLDYCGEFLSLIGKLAALYSQSLPDEVVIQSSSEIENLCSNMAGKIWQKLSILNEQEDHRSENV